jgi:hypothetical protein
MSQTQPDDTRIVIMRQTGIAHTAGIETQRNCVRFLARRGETRMSSVKLLAASLHGVVQMPYDGYFGEGIDTLSGAASSAHEGADEIRN